MSIDLSQFIPTFLEESYEGLELMESSLLNLEQGGEDTINAIFRAAHSIKGGAGTFGFNQVTDFTHEVETLLDEMRDGRRQVEQSSVNLLLKSVDCIRLLIDAAKDGQECSEPSIEENFTAIQALLKGESAEPVSAPTASEMSAQPDETSASQSNTWLIEFIPSHEILQTGNDVLRLFGALEELGQLTAQVELSELPPISDLDPEECHLSWQLRLVSDCPEEEITEVFEWVEDECELTISQAANQSDTTDAEFAATVDEPAEKAPDVQQVISSAPAQPANESKESRANDAAKPVTQAVGSIRVGIDKVDKLINRVGELVITQSMLKQIGSEFEDDDNDIINRLREGLVQLEGNSRDLQEDVMRIRMLPISFVFNRFPRMVYDVSSKLGKLVEVKLSGENTELDKTVMEKIGDPLVHLVRNSLDHGLETPEERVAAGKDETGLVHLNAYHQGGYINIDITDDGRGLNTQKIYQKALEKGLINAEQSLTDQEINELIFAPGFSTADVVSDLSGRGVGMDVVRRNIESLGGHVSLSSTMGEGSTFSVCLPLTLAILDGQLINVAGQTYIVPLISIVESMQINQNAIKGIAGQQSLYLYREQYIPLYSIRNIFALPQKPGPYDDNMIIIVESSGHKYALVVDELLDQEQVVLKSLETNYLPVEGISGATILGHGGVALIIDIKGLHTLKQKQQMVSPMSYGQVVAQEESICTST